MATISIERGVKTACLWRFLCERNVKFTVERIYEINGESRLVEFAISNEAVAVEAVLRYG